MKKREVIKKKQEFNEIIHTCPFIKNKYFTIYIRKKDEEKVKFGLAISKKVGNAVVRNKLKRQVRTIIDNNKELFSNNHDYIIMIKVNCVEVSYQKLNEKMIELIKEKK